LAVAAENPGQDAVFDARIVDPPCRAFFFCRNALALKCAMRLLEVLTGAR
jgi:hypothetical protein